MDLKVCWWINRIPITRKTNKAAKGNMETHKKVKGGKFKTSILPSINEAIKIKML
jgi:hypothetical protein